MQYTTQPMTLPARGQPVVHAAGPVYDPRWRWLVWAGFCAAFVGLLAIARFTGMEALTGGPRSVASALALALVALSGRSAIPVVLVAQLLADWLLRADTGARYALLAADLASSAVYCIGGLSIRRWTRWVQGGIGVRDLSVFVAIVVGISIAVTAVHGIVIVAGGMLPPDRLAGALLAMSTAQAVGQLCFAPLMLVLAARWRGVQFRRSLPRLQTALASVFFVVLVTAILFVVFALKPFDELRMFYLVLVPIIAVSMRYGMSGAAIAVPAVQVGLLVALALVVTRAATSFEFQLLMLAVALTALYVGALSDERDRTAAQAAAQELALREQAAALGDAQRTASTAELAAALAHDLNQPLSAIGTYARACRLLLERGSEGGATLLTTLQQIEQESARAGQYVRRMRDFFRTGTIHVERLSARALVENARVLQQDRLKRDGVHFRSRVAPDAGYVRADVVQVGAVFGNLIGNACDALAAFGGPRVIEIHADRVSGTEGAFVRFCVIDNGPGVPPELREQLFKPLETSKPHGMGLGLALSRSIAERQGGRLWFDQTAPRTTFCLDLPADEDAAPVRNDLAHQEGG